VSPVDRRPTDVFSLMMHAIDTVDRGTREEAAGQVPASRCTTGVMSSIAVSKTTT
jgi:hypothetical protein